MPGSILRDPHAPRGDHPGRARALQARRRRPHAGGGGTARAVPAAATDRRGGGLGAACIASTIWVPLPYRSLRCFPLGGADHADRQIEPIRLKSHGAHWPRPCSMIAPTLWLRLEGAAVFGAGLLAYFHMDGGWLLLFLLLLAPDLSMLGYLGGSRSGAAAYN